MKKNTEYREPEFKVVMTAQQDVLTASGEGVLATVSDYWDTSRIDGGSFTFGL